MAEETEKIPPRTKSERKAYIEGYADALHDAQHSGMLSAVTWLADMVEIEKELEKRKDDGRQAGQ
jgi:hypothetical protein